MTVTTEAPAQGTPAAGDGKQEAPKADAAGVEKKQETQQATTEKPKEPEKKPEAAAEAASELVLKFPEGLKVDDALVKSFTEVAKKSGIKGEHAQAIADVFVNREKARVEAADRAEKETRSKWEADLKADKEFGGANLDATRAAASKAVERLGGKDLSDAITAMGLDSHPALVKALARAGKAISEDSVAGATGAGDSSGVSPKEKQLRSMFPKSFK